MWLEYSGVRAGTTLNTAFCSSWFGVFKKGMRVTRVPHIIASVLRYKQYQPLDSNICIQINQSLRWRGFISVYGNLLFGKFLFLSICHCSCDSNYILNKYFYADSVVALPCKCYQVDLHIKLNFWAVFVKGNLDKGYFTSDFRLFSSETSFQFWSLDSYLAW